VNTNFIYGRILAYPPLVYLGWIWLQGRRPLEDGERSEDRVVHVGEDTPLLGSEAADVPA
jgi:hypothetical protein